MNKKKIYFIISACFQVLLSFGWKLLCSSLIDTLYRNIYDLVINGGIYIMKKSLIETIPEGVKSSLEKDLIPNWIKEGKLITAEVSDARFIDIGTPDSLQEFKERKEEFQEL